MRAYLLPFFYLVLGFVSAQALPPILTYSTETYGAGSQNWAISQDDRGFIYAANNLGLLEYDGERWSLYSSPNESIIRSVAAVGDRVYTGSYMDFGYWSLLSTGGRAYTSLGENVRSRIKVDEQIWNIMTYDGQVVFQSLSQLFLYDPETNESTVITGENGITRLFRVDGDLYVTDGYHQLFRLEGGGLSDPLITEGPKYPLVYIWEEDKQLYFQTANNGAFSLSNGGLVSIGRHPTLAGKSLYCATALRDGGVAFGTISSGLFVTDRNGMMTQALDQRTGLANNTVLSLFEDRDNNIWAGTDNGISCSNLTSPFRKFTDKTGRLGTVHASASFEGKLYLGSNQGLFVQDPDGKEAPRLVEGTKAQVWSLFVHEGYLFCGHDRGTYVIKGETATLLEGEAGTWCFVPIPGKPGLLLRGGYTGIEVLENQQGEWRVRNKINHFDVSSRFMALGPDKDLYVGHEYRGVYGLQLDQDFREVKAQKLYESPDKGKNVGLTGFEGQVYYYSREGIFTLRNFRDGFVRSEELSSLFDSEEYTSGNMTAEGDRLWFFTSRGISYLEEGALSGNLVRRIISVPGESINAKLGYENLSHLGGEVVLVGAADGYLLLSLSELPDNTHEVYLRKVTARTAEGEETSLSIPAASDLHYLEHNVAFYLAVPAYDRYFMPKYQYRLPGLHEEWTEWQSAPLIELAEVKPGDYAIEIRSLLGGTVSENTLRYSFVINQPWYRTYPAIFLYVLLGTIAAIVLNGVYKRYYTKKQQVWRQENERRVAAQQREAELNLTRLNNERLREDVASKSREMALSTMNLVKKNELLQYIKDELQAKRDPALNIRDVVKTIDENINEAETWNLFKEAFENADRDFFNTIKAKHPQLSANDLKLCAYLRLNLSSKEIAPMLNISTRSVEVKRYRLRKKMELDHEVSLADYIISL